MNIVESIIKQGEEFTAARLQCGHVVNFGRGVSHVQIGGRMPCPTCDERRENVQPATKAQLEAIAAEYAARMRALGFDVPEGNMPVLRRAAAIQDAWRIAFKRVLGS